MYFDGHCINRFRDDDMFLISQLLTGSAVNMVIMNFFNGFTRNCWQCAGKEWGEPCPDFITHCHRGRVFFLLGSSLQTASMVRCHCF